jgi:hypothetical protein
VAGESASLCGGSTGIVTTARLDICERDPRGATAKLECGDCVSDAVVV